MNITVYLPKDRTKEGTISFDGGRTYRCRGKADNQSAAQHGNPDRTPSVPWGDHPDGVNNVFEVRDVAPADRHSYGPYKLCLRAVSGDTLTRQNAETEWDGLEAHGGDLQADGVSLRATYGCLRMDNLTVTIIALAARAALARGEEVTYTCESV